MHLMKDTEIVNETEILLNLHSIQMYLTLS